MKRARLFGRGRDAEAPVEAAADRDGAFDVQGDAYEAYHEALRTAEHAYDEARGTAEETYHVAQAKADALIAQGALLYQEAALRGRDYGERAARGARDNKALALLLSAGVGYVLALALKRRPS